MQRLRRRRQTSWTGRNGADRRWAKRRQGGGEMLMDPEEYRRMAIPVLAYIDPESGSLLLQMLIATFIGFLVSLRHKISELVSWYRRKKQPKTAEVD